MGIGNDIVDLLAPEAGNKHLDQRYAGRAFTVRELDAIQNSPKPGPLFWAIWACKEAAYKALGQDHPGISSWPKKYDVELQIDGDKGEGGVKTPVGEVFVRVDFFERFVHALAATDKDDLDRVNFGVAECKPEYCKTCMHSHAKHGNEQDGAFRFFRKRQGSEIQCRGRVSLTNSSAGREEPGKPGKNLLSGLKSAGVFADEQRNAGLRNPTYDRPNGIAGWVEPCETQQQSNRLNLQSNCIAPVQGADRSRRDASALVRRLALQDMACLYNLDYSALQIVRKKQDGKLGPPLVLCGDAELPVSLSLSHDVPYLAWAFLLKNQKEYRKV